MKSSNVISECQQCGVCCEKGGPAFHRADKPLVEKGIILSKYLFTIREGEPAHENVKGGLTRVPSDIIKIKGKGDAWRCVFLDEMDKSCRIYENRPVECRALKCWDTKDIEKIYLRDLLYRKDLISGMGGIWELVEDHQQRCDYGLIETLSRLFKDSNDKDAEERILEMIRYDAHLRELIVKKGNMDKETLDFLFGRPLLKTITMFGLIVQQDGGQWCLRIKT
ncbi:MAG: YkgJ family cysteine cluster protein [Deltaproteobacteria bacterium]|nr:YkgJ family cysteine cluster protein [Deltaproteobacteria bacterium]MBW1984359.1 YkgJ family cysteine cluster protein [Deltaproteobacteria bacterium]MBW2180139.1 YkgJ family cysteine cluster protein [Deltaproteobacteria bacterium]MBW2363912.1 YkgJ family cysteine cluster protein [Deltaproteobacteria bacterium]